MSRGVFWFWLILVVITVAVLATIAFRFLGGGGGFDPSKVPQPVQTARVSPVRGILPIRRKEALKPTTAWI